ncbi:DUF5133 domain-containing protein [Streptacidiphilus cavernicola]|uniref:DUF5133 domain-containing protein n=1 Tax=Streptacidiphilus cavernicola TaxID=3342716 RepID=A0ABV6VPK8_9ACTN
MPLINPVELRRLVTELDALEAAPEGPGTERRRADLHYTLCVSTGIRDAARAVEQARRLLTPQLEGLAPAAA